VGGRSIQARRRLLCSWGHGGRSHAGPGERRIYTRDIHALLKSWHASSPIPFPEPSFRQACALFCEKGSNLQKRATVVSSCSKSKYQLIECHVYPILSAHTPPPHSSPLLSFYNKVLAKLATCTSIYKGFGPLSSPLLFFKKRRSPLGTANTLPLCLPNVPPRWGEGERRGVP
jgi:hypothetical protein